MREGMDMEEKRQQVYKKFANCYGKKDATDRGSTDKIKI